MSRRLRNGWPRAVEARPRFAHHPIFPRRTEARMHIDLSTISAIEGYKLLTNLVVPRPIAWITSMDAHHRVNAAPFSFFNLLGSDPAVVAIGVGNDSQGL